MPNNESWFVDALAVIYEDEQHLSAAHGNFWINSALPTASLCKRRLSWASHTPIPTEEQLVNLPHVWHKLVHQEYYNEPCEGHALCTDRPLPPFGRVKFEVVHSTFTPTGEQFIQAKNRAQADAEVEQKTRTWYTYSRSCLVRQKKGTDLIDRHRGVLSRKHKA